MSWTTLDHIDDLGTFHVRWDNGSGLGLVIGEDSFSVLPPEPTLLKLYMPLTADLYERNRYGDLEEESTELDARDLVDFIEPICTEMKKTSMPEERKRGIMHWYSQEDSVNEKVRSAVFTVDLHDGRLWGVAECQVLGELSTWSSKVLLCRGKPLSSGGFIAVFFCFCAVHHAGHKKAGCKAKKGYDKNHRAFKRRREDFQRGGNHEPQYDSRDCGVMLIEQRGDQSGKQKHGAANADQKRQDNGEIQRADAGGQRLIQSKENQNGGGAQAGDDEAQAPQEAAEDIGGKRGGNGRGDSVLQQLEQQICQGQGEHKGRPAFVRAALFGRLEQLGNRAADQAEKEHESDLWRKIKQDLHAFCKENKAEHPADQKRREHLIVRSPIRETQKYFPFHPLYGIFPALTSRM